MSCRCFSCTNTLKFFSCQNVWEPLHGLHRKTPSAGRCWNESTLIPASKRRSLFLAKYFSFEFEFRLDRDRY